MRLRIPMNARLLAGGFRRGGPRLRAFRESGAAPQCRSGIGALVSEPQTAKYRGLVLLDRRLSRHGLSHRWRSLRGPHQRQMDCRAARTRSCSGSTIRSGARLSAGRRRSASCASCALLKSELSRSARPNRAAAALSAIKRSSSRRAANGAASTLIETDGAKGFRSIIRCCASSTATSSRKTLTKSTLKTLSSAAIAEAEFARKGEEIMRRALGLGRRRA